MDERMSDGNAPGSALATDAETARLAWNRACDEAEAKLEAWRSAPPGRRMAAKAAWRSACEVSRAALWAYYDARRRRDRVEAAR